MKPVLLSTLLTIFGTCINGAIVSYDNLINVALPSSFNNVKAATTVTFNEDISPNIGTSSTSTQATEEEISCIKEQLNFQSCFTITQNDSKSCSALLDDEKCKNFFKDPMSQIPSCKKLIQAQQDYLEHYLKYNVALINLLCAESGKCPMLEDLLLFSTGQYGNKVQWTSPETKKKGYIPSDDTIKETCKSSKCFECSNELLTEMAALNDSSLKLLNEKPELSDKIGDDFVQRANDQTNSLKQASEKLNACKGNATSSVPKKFISNIIFDTITVIAVFILYNY